MSKLKQPALAAQPFPDRPDKKYITEEIEKFVKKRGRARRTYELAEAAREHSADHAVGAAQWTDFRPASKPLTGFSLFISSLRQQLLCCIPQKRKLLPAVKRIANDQIFWLALHRDDLLSANCLFVDGDLTVDKPLVKLLTDRPVLRICERFRNRELRTGTVDIRFHKRGRRETLTENEERRRYENDAGHEHELLVDGIPESVWLDIHDSYFRMRIEYDNAKSSRGHFFRKK